MSRCPCHNPWCVLPSRRPSPHPPSTLPLSFPFLLLPPRSRTCQKLKKVDWLLKLTPPPSLRLRRWRVRSPVTAA
jgi:hypothetical protein